MIDPEFPSRTVRLPRGLTRHAATVVLQWLVEQKLVDTRGDFRGMVYDPLTGEAVLT